MDKWKDLREYAQNKHPASEVPMTAGEVTELIKDYDELRMAAVKYDEALTSCANDPSKMASFCTTQGDDLDALYFDLMGKARK